MRHSIHSLAGHAGRAVFFLSAALALGLAGCATVPAASPTEAATFHVSVGYEDVAQAWEAESFFPRDITVNVGDRVVFTMKSHEAHTITFNAPQPVPEPFIPQADHNLAANPVIFFSSPPTAPADPRNPVALTATFDGTGYVNSGFLRKQGDSLTVSFAAPGTYKVLCLLHSESMSGTITVNAPGSARPTSDQVYQAMAVRQVNDAKARAAALLKKVATVPPVTRPDGTRSFMVYAGLGSVQDGIDYMRFVGGEQLSIKVGDSVTYDMSRNSKGAPHTVTFLSGTEDPDLVIPQPQDQGPPKLLLNPKVLMPAPLPPGPFDGTSYYNSGLMLSGGPTPQSFTVTYTKPGTFKYQCIFHDDDGMKASVIVSP
jgi:plastocyanin